jgi:hypothetical protein
VIIYQKNGFPWEVVSIQSRQVFKERPDAILA